MGLTVGPLGKFVWIRGQSETENIGVNTVQQTVDAECEWKLTLHCNCSGVIEPVPFWSLTSTAYPDTPAPTIVPGNGVEVRGNNNIDECAWKPKVHSPVAGDWGISHEVTVKYKLKTGVDETGAPKYLRYKEGDVFKDYEVPFSTGPITVFVFVSELEGLQFNLAGTWHDAPDTFKQIELNYGATFRAKLNPEWADGFVLAENLANALKWKQDSVDKGAGASKGFTFSDTGTTNITVTVGEVTKSTSVEVGPANGTVAITWKDPEVTTHDDIPGAWGDGCINIRLRDWEI
jgi:hypothetical protein